MADVQARPERHQWSAASLAGSPGSTYGNPGPASEEPDAIPSFSIPDPGSIHDRGRSGGNQRLCHRYEGSKRNLCDDLFPHRKANRTQFEPVKRPKFENLVV